MTGSTINLFILSPQTHCQKFAPKITTIHPPFQNPGSARVLLLLTILILTYATNTVHNTVYNIRFTYAWYLKTHGCTDAW